MCYENESWTRSLPIILLGLRTIWRADFEATPAELLYGESIRLPCDFFEDTLFQPQSEFVQTLKATIKDFKPVPFSYHSKQKPFVFKDLKDCSHVCIKQNDCGFVDLVILFRESEASQSINQPYSVRSLLEREMHVVLTGKKTKEVSLISPFLECRTKNSASLFCLLSHHSLTGCLQSRTSILIHFIQNDQSILTNIHHLIENEEITCLAMDESKIGENQVGSSKDFSQNELHITDENTLQNSDFFKLFLETRETTWFTFLSKLRISEVKNIKRHFTGNQLNSKSLSCGTLKCQEASSFLNGSATEVQQKKVNSTDLNPKPCVKECELKTSQENHQSFLCHSHKLDASSFECSNKVDEKVTSYISSAKERKCTKQFCKSWEFSQGHFSSTSLEKISDPRLDPVIKRKSDILKEIPLKRVKWNKTSNTKPSSCSKDLNQNKKVYSTKSYKNKNVYSSMSYQNRNVYSSMSSQNKNVYS
ncbi:uncharacterized protein TNIN_152461, partial [Trichonephila inaurata madagascariensis]